MLRRKERKRRKRRKKRKKKKKRKGRIMMRKHLLTQVLRRKGRRWTE